MATRRAFEEAVLADVRRLLGQAAEEGGAVADLRKVLKAFTAN
ncbi:hypothetical protein [Pseudomonas sp. KNUC1026]|nr:hypothetical protein [Pseudomonas sp. KNUC1026]